MSKKILIVLFGLLAILFAGCQAQGASEEVQQQLSSIQSQLDDLMQNADTGSLQSEIEDLSTQFADAAMRDQVFQVNMANVMLETAGFHDIDDSINNEGVIDPAFLGTVNRIQLLLGSTSWPEEFHTDLMGFQGTLTDLSMALSDDDVDAAGPLAEAAHEQQHELSHSLSAWLSEHGSGMAMEGMDDHTHDESMEGMDHEHGDRIPNEGGATIHIHAPADGDIFASGEDVVVEVEVENFTLDEASNHWHVYVDGESYGMVVGGQLLQALTGLAPGEHEISVYLSNADHQEYEDGDSIMITVQEGS